MTAFTRITIAQIMPTLMALSAWPVDSSFGGESYDERLSAVRQSIREDYPSVRQITTQELASWLTDTNRLPPFLLDVRSEDEYRVSHLKNARHMTQQMPVSSVTDALEANQAVVVYCSVGVRSSELALKLAQAGLVNIYNLDGSIFLWANEGRPLYLGNDATQWVHPYNRSWGRCLKKELHGKVPSPQKGTR